MARLTCTKCQKTMDEGQFYKLNSGERAEYCKKCLTMHIDNYNPETFLWILEKLDVPYIPQEWNTLRDRAFNANPEKMTGMSVIGKYLSKMKLSQWGKYRWADTEKLQQELDEKAAAAIERNKQLEEELKVRLDAGEISEAEYKTLTSEETQYNDMRNGTSPIGVGMPGPSPYASGGQYGVAATNNPYIEKNFMDPSELPDIGAELTQEDKVALATKWGLAYTPAEWVQLEKLYSDFMNSFTIVGAARIDTLKFICKTSLKMNQALDSSDIETYQKLSKVYDAQMKAAKFTEAQNKEQKTDTFDAIGQMVALCEKLKGKIPRYDISVPQDKVDFTIKDLKEYNYSLITQDVTLANQIEAYLKQRASLEAKKARERMAAASGDDSINDITNEDFIQNQERIEEELAQDEKLFGGDENQ